jgi:GAF domain-containing protein
MEPTAETQAALAHLAWTEDSDLARALKGQVAQARAVVPSLLGVSLGWLHEGLTFTFVASSATIATLDAMQYLDGGPCVDALRQDDLVDVPEVAGILDEDRWQLFSEVVAANGVRATLSLPVLHDEQVACGVNLYAGETHAFEGRHERLADIFGAWVGGAVTNADLSFSTRREAARAPARLQALNRFNEAVGIVAARQGVDTDEARRRIENAAALAGIAPDDLAVAVLKTTRPHSDSS